MRRKVGRTPMLETALRYSRLGQRIPTACKKRDTFFVVTGLFSKIFSKTCPQDGCDRRSGTVTGRGEEMLEKMRGWRRV